MRFEVGTNLHDEDLNVSSGDYRRSRVFAARQPPAVRADGALLPPPFRGIAASPSVNVKPESTAGAATFRRSPTAQRARALQQTPPAGVAALGCASLGLGRLGF